MTDLKLAFGAVGSLPKGVTTAWGARLIWPNDLVYDRQDLQGPSPNAEALAAWLHEGPLRSVLDDLKHPALNGLSPDDDRTVVLYTDGTGCIVGNPQRSHGYLYVAAWLYKDRPPQVHKFESSSEAYDASQTDDLIRDGDVLVCEDGVVGFLCSAWPVAVSSTRGQFHSPVKPWDMPVVIDGTDYSRSFELARTEMV